MNNTSDVKGMEENRVIRRNRPRPYDLRRKVLLKNFLREQMTYIPSVPLTSVVSTHCVTSSEESTSSTKIDLEELNTCSSVAKEDSQCELISCENVQDPPVDAENNDKSDNAFYSSNDRKSNTTKETNLFKFPSLIGFKIKAKPKKAKGILKAKQICKSNKLNQFSLKTSKVNLTKLPLKQKLHDESSKRSKSFFSLLKSKKSEKKLKCKINASPVKDCKQFNSEVAKNSTLDQSVQTDENWTREKLEKVEESNRLLREENRLLSESLSYFMSSTSLDAQINQTQSNLIQSTSQPNVNLRRFSTSHVSTNNSIKRSKVFRSKSLEDHGEKSLTRNYCTRSTSNRNTLYKYHFTRGTQFKFLQNETSGNNLSPITKKNILSDLNFNHNSSRIIRRSSMPEKLHSKNDRSRICYRSNSLRNNLRKPFSTLPSDAFY